MARLLGFDVSAYNGSSVNYFKELHKFGGKFVFVKLSEGLGWKSPIASAQIKHAFDVGIETVGAYHFYHGGGKAEARQFLTEVKLNHLDKTTPLMLDAETTDIGGMSGINEFFDECSKYGYHNLFIYSMASFFGHRIFVSKLKNNVKLWVANYGGSIGVNNTAIWQFTDDYKASHTDANYCFFPETLGAKSGNVEDSDSDKIKNGDSEYYKAGSIFEALKPLNCYGDAGMTQVKGRLARSKGYKLHAKPFKYGHIYRLKTEYGNYYTANAKYVKRIK